MPASSRSYRPLSRLIIGPLMASSLVFATPAIATQDLFLRLSGIEGSSTDERHRREIELESYSQSVQSGANFGYGSGAAGKAASCGDIVVSKQIDAASPGLIMSVLTGARIANGTITFRRAGREQQEYYTVQMTEVIVTSVEQSDVAATSAPVKEIIKMKARQFRFNYFPQKPDGSLGPVQTFGFDCVSNSRL